MTTFCSRSPTGSVRFSSRRAFLPASLSVMSSTSLWSSPPYHHRHYHHHHLRQFNDINLFFQLVIVAQLMPQIVAAKHPVSLFVMIFIIRVIFIISLMIIIFRWPSLSFGSCVLDTMLAYFSSRQVSFIIIINDGPSSLLRYSRDHPHHVGDILLSGAHLWDARPPGASGAQWLLKVPLLSRLKIESRSRSTFIYEYYVHNAHIQPLPW